MDLPKRQSVRVIDTDFVYPSAARNTRSKSKDSAKSAEKSCSPKVSQAQDVRKMEHFEGMLKLLEDRINELETQKLHLSKSSNSPSKSMAEAQRMDKTDRMRQPQPQGLEDEIFNDFMAALPMDAAPRTKSGMHDKLKSGASSGTTGKGSLKSGFDVSSQVEIVKKVKWPHGFCNKIANFTNTTPENLSMEAFFYGFFEILLCALEDESELIGRLTHGKQVLWHTIHHNWRSAREFHYQVLREIEVGNLEWTDIQEMQILSLSAAEGSGKVEKSNVEANTKGLLPTRESEVISSSSTTGDVGKQATIFCYLYNNDESGCRFEKELGQCKKLHACSTCATKGFLNRHRAAFDCRNNPAF